MGEAPEVQLFEIQLLNNAKKCFSLETVTQWKETLMFYRKDNKGSDFRVSNKLV
jgi:hypothetical protein